MTHHAARFTLSAMSVLSDRTIKEQIAAGRILIDPLDEDAIQPASVDLRLDDSFRIFRMTTRALRRMCASPSTT